MNKMFFTFFLVLLLLCGCASVETPEEIVSSESAAEEETSSETEEETKPEDVPVVNGWTPDFKPEDFETYEEYEKAFLDEFVKHLEPSEFFETEKEYPAVILEIFDLMMEQQPDVFKCEELLKIDVLGDENEFYVTYKYISKEGAEEFRSVRVRKTEEGRYGVLGYGGGAPIGYGLEKSDITLEDILNEN